MDESRFSISADELIARMGRAGAPLILDVRPATAFASDTATIAGALRRAPEGVDAWAAALPAAGTVVCCCVHGHEVSRNTAAALRARGRPARYLEGGIEAWRAGGRPTMRKRWPVCREESAPSLWVTRERPKIDRIACPWLVRRFIDPTAEFLFVPADRVAAAAAETGGIPYDIPGVEFSHVGERCSFDAFLELFAISDAALGELALVVRGADTARLDLAAQAAGLLAVSLGLSALHPDDHAMLAAGLPVYDAFYAWCRFARGEPHGWPPKG